MHAQRLAKKTVFLPERPTSICVFWLPICVLMMHFESHLKFLIHRNKNKNVLNFSTSIEMCVFFLLLNWVKVNCFISKVSRIWKDIFMGHHGIYFIPFDIKMHLKMLLDIKNSPFRSQTKCSSHFSILQFDNYRPKWHINLLLIEQHFEYTQKYFIVSNEVAWNSNWNKNEQLHFSRHWRLAHGTSNKTTYQMQ